MSYNLPPSSPEPTYVQQGLVRAFTSLLDTIDHGRTIGEIRAAKADFEAVVQELCSPDSIMTTTVEATTEATTEAPRPASDPWEGY